MKEPYGSQSRIIREIILTRVGRHPIQARTLKEYVANDYGDFCLRNFWRQLRKLRESGTISRIGTFRNPWEGGYVYGHHG